jgi:hypothetical protein
MGEEAARLKLPPEPVPEFLPRRQQARSQGERRLRASVVSCRCHTGRPGQPRCRRELERFAKPRPLRGPRNGCKQRHSPNHHQLIHRRGIDGMRGYTVRPFVPLPPHRCVIKAASPARPLRGLSLIGQLHKSCTIFIGFWFASMLMIAGPAGATLAIDALH